MPWLAVLRAPGSSPPKPTLPNYVCKNGSWSYDSYGVLALRAHGVSRLSWMHTRTHI